MASLIFKQFTRQYKVPANIKRLVKFNKVPKIDFETEVKEVIARSSGPGGQNVNKSNNCVTLIHLETKVTVKCQDSRSLPKNRDIARSRLIDKLDWHLNKEESVEAQVKKIEKEREILRKEAAKRKREEKKLKNDQQVSDKTGKDEPSICADTQSNDGENGVEKPT